MSQKIQCEVFTERKGATIQRYINSFLSKESREFVSATQSESHGGHFGDLNITITIWYKEVK